MSRLEDMMSVRDDLAAVLDSKFKDVPEWRAYRKVDRIVSEMRSSAVQRPAIVPAKETAKVLLSSGEVTTLRVPYASLARRFIEAKGRPVTTPELMDYIRENRDMGTDEEKAKVNVTSTLSKSSLFESIPWKGGRAWILKGMGVSKSAPASSIDELFGNTES
jgi:hypothetical protein